MVRRAPAGRRASRQPRRWLGCDDRAPRVRRLRDPCRPPQRRDRRRPQRQPHPTPSASWPRSRRRRLSLAFRAVRSTHATGPSQHQSWSITWPCSASSASAVQLSPVRPQSRGIRAYAAGVVRSTGEGGTRKVRAAVRSTGPGGVIRAFLLRSKLPPPTLGAIWYERAPVTALARALADCRGRDVVAAQRARSHSGSCPTWTATAP